jgi:hypothetical protein
MNISRTNGTLSSAANFFRSLPLSTYCTLHGPRLICGHLLWVIGMRLPDGEYVIVVSASQSDEVHCTRQKIINRLISMAYEDIYDYCIIPLFLRG